MIGRVRNKKVEIHITLLKETAEELEALMKHEGETKPSREIDRAIYTSYSKLPSEVKAKLKATQSIRGLQQIHKKKS
jgi:hypothetical protein